MDLLNSLLGSMTSNSSIDALAGKSGASTDSVQKAISSALPSLLGSLTKNASTTSGAKSLLGALSQHEDASDVSSQIKNADEKDGGKIIGKILGDGKDDFISSIAKEAGINVGQSSQILSSIAPALLSAIASASKSDSDTSKKNRCCNFFFRKSYCRYCKYHQKEKSSLRYFALSCKCSGRFVSAGSNQRY